MLKERKYFKADVIPLTSDLKKIASNASQQIIEEHHMFLQEPSSNTWRRLSKAVYVGLTLFNRRRGGEVAKMHAKC